MSDKHTLREKLHQDKKLLELSSPWLESRVMVSGNY